MEEFKCKRCGHEATSLWNLKSHLGRSKPCPDLNLCGKTQGELLEEITIDKAEWEFECDACGAKYKSRQGLYLHKKNKKCNAEDVKRHQYAAGTSVSINNSQSVVAVVNSPGAVVNSPVTINININNFGEEKIDYVVNDKEFMEKNMKCLSTLAITNIINRIYNDADHPENKTVHSQSKKNNTYKIRKDDGWIVAHGQTVIPKMIQKGYEVATTHFFSNPEAVQSDIKDGEENGTHPPRKHFLNSLTNSNSVAFKNEYAKTKQLAHNY